MHQRGRKRLDGAGVGPAGGSVVGSDLRQPHPPDRHRRRRQRRIGRRIRGAEGEEAEGEGLGGHRDAGSVVHRSSSGSYRVRVWSGGGDDGIGMVHL